MIEAITRRTVLGWLSCAALGVVACNPDGRADSRRQAWTILIDLSGTAAVDRRYYVNELARFVRELADLKPTVITDIVGFSGFAKPLLSGQAQHIVRDLTNATNAIERWPRDPHTDHGAAFRVAHDVQRQRAIDRRIVWCLSDGVHDPTNRWSQRPERAAPLPDDIPLAAMRDADTYIHWDCLDEHQFSGWQRLFEQAKIPATLHLHGHVETPRARLQRLPRIDEIEQARTSGAQLAEKKSR